jgi:(S)-mandelate dehydrogenase
MSTSIQRFYSIADLRSHAKKRLPKAIFDFFDGGAEDELTLRRNVQAFQEKRLIPKVLNDVSSINHSAPMLGGLSSLPCAIAPTGAVAFGWPKGDIAIAKAAAAFNIPYCLSTTATASIEQIAREAPGRHWFQAYILKNRVFFDQLLQRAHDADYEALMITVDLPVGGKRERDSRNDFKIPFHLTLRNFIDFSSRPFWALPMLFKGIPELANLIGLETANPEKQNLGSSVGKNYDPSFNWERLARIRDQWPRKLIIKGVLNPEDAQRLVQLGCDAIVVSNHGGRQLDGSIATLDALPDVVRAVNQAVPVYIDGGIRRGSDIVKALASGANGVLIGRATLYGAIAAGEEGAHHALAILQDELKRTMQLCGVSKLKEIDQTLLARPHSSP